MKILLIIWGIIAVLIIHNYIKKWVPYRWLINSIAFPVNFYRIKKRWRYLSHGELSQIYLDLTTFNYWFEGAWFYKKVLAYLTELIINKKQPPYQY